MRDGLKMLISTSDTELMNVEVGECYQRISNIHKKLGNLYSAEDTEAVCYRCGRKHNSPIILSIDK